jgi:hypothetical protein
MTPAQLATLKTAIIADPVAGPMRAAGDAYSLLAWCNGPSATLAWRTAVSGTEIYDAHKPVEYIARSNQERGAFDLMCDTNRQHDFTVAAKRNGVADIFSGATNSTSRTAIFTVAKEFATNAQLALGGSNASVGGTGNMSETVTAFKRNFAGQVTTAEASLLVN